MKHLFLFTFIGLGMSSSLSFAQTSPHPFPEYLSRVPVANSTRMTGLLGEAPPDHPLQVNAREFLKNISRGIFLFGNHCSASFVSSEGHALTALHCLGRISRESVQGNLPLNYMLTPRRDLIGTDIQITKQNLEQFGYTPNEGFGEKVRVLAMGAGFPNNEMLRKGVHESYARYNHDWALVKFEKLPPTHRCVKIASQKPQKEALLWALGYPDTVDSKTQTLDWLYSGTPMFLTRFMQAGPDKSKLNKMLLDLYAFYRKIRHESPSPDPYLVQESFRAKHSLYISTGRFFSDAKELMNITKWPLPSAQRMDTVYDGKKHFVSTLSIAGGMSGGGVFNTSGQLVGINVASLGGPAVFESFQMGARHVSVKEVLEEIKSSLGTAELERAFDCKLTP